MTKPIIGVSGSWITDQGGMFPGYHRSYVNDDYIDSVVQAGGVPFIIPVTADKEVIHQQIHAVDALILSGGHDITPQLYHEEPHQKLGEIFPMRDEFEFELIKQAEARNIPILGICRGAQLLTVYHGGSLYQDLSLYPHEALKHDQAHEPTLKSHYVTIEDNSIFHEIFDTNKLMVNSFHHQLIKQLPHNLVARAHATDGVIEAFENTDYNNVELGVQWHPEMLHRTTPEMSNLFKYIVMSAKGAK